MGGMTEAIEAGFVQTEIQKSAYKYEMEIEENERIIVGVNKYQVKEPEHKGLLKIDIKVQEEQIKFLKKIRSERNNEVVDKNLSTLKKAAEGTDNLMPFILEAVKSYATIGEICNTMRSVFGEYKEHVVI
jgi:methylmalonyl-CoA mutase N-terminal domain/subunit